MEDNINLPALSKQEEGEVMKLAAVGFLAKEIAASMEISLLTW